MKLLILQSLPGAGKTTWAKDFCEKNQDWTRINRDDLRWMTGKYNAPKREGLITDWENLCIVSALGNGYNVILDATNLNKDRNKSRIEKLRYLMVDLGYGDNSNFEVEYKFFDVSVEECIKRDAERTIGKVGEKVIRQFYDKYLKPKPVIYREDKSLPHCVIFDVDGTLAIKGNRSPYDWNRVKEDTINQPVFDVLTQMSLDEDLKIIIFTGRDGICEKDTREWLIENRVYFDALFIRPEGNNEKDSIIKKRMFEENIRGKYYCYFWVDDRKQVKRMIVQELGVFVFDVNQNDEEF